MANDRDHWAVSLRRQQWSYTRIAEYLGYPDRRAAHRGVQRALAEPAAAEAQLRGLRAYEASEQLLDVQRRLFVLLELHRPSDPFADHRVWCRIVDALLRVTDQRCRLHGLYTHPWRYDHWSRRDMPLLVRVQLEWRAAQLERQARVPVRWRAPKCALSAELAPAVTLRPAERRRANVDSSLVPASVRQLLDQLAA